MDLLLETLRAKVEKDLKEPRPLKEHQLLMENQLLKEHLLSMANQQLKKHLLSKPEEQMLRKKQQLLKEEKQQLKEEKLLLKEEQKLPKEQQLLKEEKPLLKEEQQLKEEQLLKEEENLLKEEQEVLLTDPGGWSYQDKEIKGIWPLYMCALIALNYEFGSGSNYSILRVFALIWENDLSFSCNNLLFLFCIFKNNSYQIIYLTLHFIKILFLFYFFNCFFFFRYNHYQLLSFFIFEIRKERINN